MEQKLDPKKMTGIFLASVIVCSLAYVLVQPWRLDLCNDTPHYYESQKYLHDPANSWKDLVVSPFFRSAGEPLVTAPQSKPVFVSALSLWGNVYSLLEPQHRKWPNRNEYFDFVFFTFWLLFILISIIGTRLAGPLTGILAAVIALIAPWSFILLYYPAYTQLSMVIFFAAQFLALKNTNRALFIAGVLSCFALLANSSMLIYIFGLGLFITLRCLPGWRRSAQSGLFFAAGFFAPFLFFEFVRLALCMKNGWKVADIDSPLTTLVKYYQRSANLNHLVLRQNNLANMAQFASAAGDLSLAKSAMAILKTLPERFPKYHGMFFRILREQSVTLWLSSIAVIVLFAVEAARNGLRRFVRIPEISAAVRIAFPAVVALVILELYPGVQFPRSYFIAYPALILAALLFWEYLCARKAVWKWIGVAILVLYGAETIHALALERQAFHSADDSLAGILKSQEKIAVLDYDPHRTVAVDFLPKPYSQHVAVARDLSHLVNFVKENASVFLLTGPEIETVCYNRYTPVTIKPFRPIEKEGIFHIDDSVLLKAGKPVSFPFYGCYPLLVMEDDFDVVRYLIRKEFGGKAFRNGPGTLLLWPLTRESAPANDVTPLVEKLRASSVEPGYEAVQLFDASPEPKAAWKSAPPPVFPVWIELLLSRPVALAGLAVQAPFTELYDPEAVKTAPRHVLVLGSTDGENFRQVASLDFDFTARGEWLIKQLPGAGEKFPVYRLAILDNHGSTDRVSIQEMRVYGE